MGKQVKPDRVVDCIGLYCPMPVLKAREEMTMLKVGQVLEIIADDPAAEEDLKYWAKVSEQEVLEVRREGGKIRFLVRRIK